LSFDFGNLLSGFFELPQLGGSQSRAELPKCPACGTDFAQIAKTGRVGCAQCYDIFDEQLLPSIRRIHGDTMHLGKLPKSAGKQARVKAELSSLKEELQEAIRVQEFERAAELRDKINSLEGGAENA
jgi:protein arginine kinase activator